MCKKRAKQAVSEILGVMLLLGITVALFSVVSLLVLSYPFNPSTPSVNMIGMVDEGKIVIQHNGGESLPLNTKVILTIADLKYNFIAEDYLDDISKKNNWWNIGEQFVYTPSLDISKLYVEVTVIDVVSHSIIMSGKIQEGETSTIPSVTTLDASDVTDSSAVLWMEYDFRGRISGELRFVYKEESATTWEETTWESNSHSGKYSVYIDGLIQWNKYVFKAQLRYDSTVIEGEEKSFIAANIPIVITEDATNLGGSSTTLNMLYDFKDYGSGDVRFVYRADWMTSWIATSWKYKSGDASYSTTVTGLSKGTTYIFKAQLRYDSTVIEGEEKTFIAGAPPSVTTKDATNIETTSATLNMGYNFEEYKIGELRFLYKAETQTDWQGTPWEARSGGVSYSKDVTGLSSGATYIFKAQLRYELGIIEGDEKQFTTEV